MVSTEAPLGPPPMELGPLAARQQPPITAISMAVLALVMSGGIYLAAFLPRRPSLVPAVGLLAAAAVLLLVNVALLARLREFAWSRFRQVAGWAMLAYVVIAGMIEYAFVYDGTSGSTLAVMTGMILVFAVNIPLLLGFSVARYDDPGAAS
jgi:hypothetical protein